MRRLFFYICFNWTQVKQIPDKAKIQTFFFLLLFREQIFLRVQRVLQVKCQNWEMRKGGDRGEIVMKKNDRVWLGETIMDMGRIKGLSPWLVLIGPTPLKLVEDWFTAVVILKLNPSPTGSFIIVFKRRKILTCVLFYSVTKRISSQQKNWAQPLFPGGGEWGSECFRN